MIIVECGGSMLGCVDISAQPNKGASQAEKAQVTLRQFVKAGKDAPILLELVNETLHQVPLFVQVLVIRPGLLAVAAGRNDRFGFFVGQHLPKIIGIVRAIRDQALKIILSDQRFCLGNVMPLPGSQPEA